MTDPPRGCGCDKCSAAHRQLNLQGDPCPCPNCADALAILTEHSNPRREEPEMDVSDGYITCKHCGRPQGVCDAHRCAARIAEDRKPDPGAIFVPAPDAGRVPEPVLIEPQVLIQPCSLYVTLTAGGATVVDARVLAWRIAGERTEIMIANTYRPEWIDCTVWEKVQFSDERGGLRRPGNCGAR